MTVGRFVAHPRSGNASRVAEASEFVGSAGRFVGAHFTVAVPSTVQAYAKKETQISTA